MKIYFTKNLWGYEKITGPPTNISKDMKTVYLTDDSSKKQELLSLGWNYVEIITKYKDVNDFKTRRQIISEINCFPSKFINEITDFEFVFVTDSNIVEIWDMYDDFVKKSFSDKCLYMVHGWYTGDRNTIKSECENSMQHRWKYDHENIKKSSEKYINEIKSMGIDEKSIPVYSAKYFGWNVKHPMYDTISKKFYEEYMNHLQGNIILSYLSVIYSNYVFSYEYEVEKNPNGKINSHNFIC
jgi:hypothetical protein